MLKRLLVALAAILWLGVSGAAAATSIAYSVATDYYGWCADYSAAEAPQCALDGCAEGGGNDCEVVLSCTGGNHAVAFADASATGFGASCGLDLRIGARLGALTVCIAATNSICWLASTFDEGGNERSNADDREFSLTFFTQMLLTDRGYDPGPQDGEMGSKTRAAIRQFQSDFALEVTGEPTEDLVYLLIDAQGGMQVFADRMRTAFNDSSISKYENTYFSAARVPAVWPSYREELLSRSEDIQRRVVAGIVRGNQNACAAPTSLEAVPPDGSAGVWYVTCPEGEYTVVMTGANTAVFPGRLSYDAGTETQVAEGETPPPADTSSKPPLKDRQGGSTEAPPSGDEAVVPSGLAIAFAHSSDDAWGACTDPDATVADCAVTVCKDNGGTDCQLTLQCPEPFGDNWAAAARADNQARGMSFSCGYPEMGRARLVALADCAFRTRSICRIVLTVGPDGALSDDENAAFTLVFQTQILLAMAGFFPEAPDGTNTEATQQAVKTF